LAVVNSLQVENSKFDPCKVFPKLFAGLGVMPDVFKIELKAGLEPYRLCAPRPIAAGLREQAKAELDRMLELNVIQPVEQPTDWCSGLTIAPKPNGKIRMCIDLTRLNAGVKRELYPLPKVSDTLSRLAKGRVFSKIDANSGFWQVILEPESRLLTTFITPWGRFCFNRMPFGISSAPEFYQRSMEKILHGLEGVVCMIDDVLVYGANADEHWLRLRKVLERIAASGMTLKKEKCEFGLPEVKFLGHVVSSEGVKLDPDKVKAICGMSPPTNKTEARRLMGMVNYLNKFGKNLAELSVPIYKITGARSEWFWGPDQQDAFGKIKLALSNAPILCAFDVNSRHRVSSDASKNAIGAVLLQVNSKGDWQPVEYASRKMTDAECRYAMIEKEALGIAWACEKFDYYLVGRKFEVETDHKPLISLLGEKDLSQLPVRVQRFKMRLMRYDFSIFHTPGKDMHIADCLSRPTDCAVMDGDIKKCSVVESFTACLVESMSRHFHDEELVKAVLEDQICQDLLKYIDEGWPDNISDFSKEFKALYKAKERLTTYGCVIMYDSRLYIPAKLRSKYLERCHDGHQGVAKCRRRAQQLFWWPGCSGDIAEYVDK
jgi:hypothetical protein